MEKKLRAICKSYDSGTPRDKIELRLAGIKIGDELEISDLQMNGSPPTFTVAGTKEYYRLSASNFEILDENHQSYVLGGGERERPVPTEDPIPPRLFVDIDGTLAEFKPVDTLETLYEKDYFRNLKPLDNVVNAIKIMKEKYPDVEVYTLSAYLTDSKYALEEKNAWLDQHLPEIDRSHRIYCPCGSDKKDYIPGGIQPTDHLMDDYTSNLLSWEPPARGIKLLNGINHTKGTWLNTRIRMDKDPALLADNIHSIMTSAEYIQDIPPQLHNIGQNPDQQQKKRTHSELRPNRRNDFQL